MTLEALDRLDDIVAELRGRSENEAETRHKLIDLVLHDVLSWPKNRVVVEEFIRPGYADYVLRKANGDDLLFVEAKRAGVFFSLPPAHAKDETHCYLGMQILMTDTNIRETMEQVRKYCIDTGCEFASITNGHEWIFFKIFEKGRRWDTL